ncbi:MAG TPA: hypothetical protein VK524_29045 [Polyangiaceae bacterium]|nr:hypothetical protein [Polyangiaceae bacterium]
MSLIAIVCAPALASCGTDIGECDMNALGGSTVQGQLAPHTGQELVNNSCAGGTCHSSSAKGPARNGAPAELDFDVVPADNSPAEVARALSGGSNVHDEAEEMWELIDSGQMPPEGKRAALASNDKETIRNWLACGAEVVAAPKVSVSVPADLTGIHGALSGLVCKSCHSNGPDNNFLSGDACAMYSALVGKTSSSSGACGTAKLPLVTAGKPDESLFLQKLSASPAPACGSTMPLASPPLGGTDPALVASIRTWILEGATKPAGCP